MGAEHLPPNKRSPLYDPDLTPEEREIAQTLSALRTLSPSAEFRNRTRSHIQMLIAETEAERVRKRPVSVARPRKQAPWRLPHLSPQFSAVLVFLLVIFLGTGYAAAHSLPGEPLYPMKRTIEQVELVLSPPEYRPTVRLKFTQRRLDELEKLVHTAASDTQVITAAEEYSKAVQETVKDLDTDTARAAVSTLQNQTTVISELTDKVPPAAQEAIIQAQEENAQAQDVAETQAVATIETPTDSGNDTIIPTDTAIPIEDQNQTGTADTAVSDETEGRASLTETSTAVSDTALPLNVTDPPLPPEQAEERLSPEPAYPALLTPTATLVVSLPVTTTSRSASPTPTPGMPVAPSQTVTATVPTRTPPTPLPTPTAQQETASNGEMTPGAPVTSTEHLSHTKDITDTMPLTTTTTLTDTNVITDTGSLTTTDTISRTGVLTSSSSVTETSRPAPDRTSGKRPDLSPPTSTITATVVITRTLPPHGSDHERDTTDHHTNLNQSTPTPTDTSTPIPTGIAPLPSKQ